MSANPSDANPDAKPDENPDAKPDAKPDANPIAEIGKIGEMAEGTALEAAWAQWSALTSLTVPAGRAPSWTLVDPEALVLTSLALARRERRLEDVVAAWARSAGFLMSKPRFKSIASLFPAEVEARLADFAAYALEGGDSRWKSWAESSDGPASSSSSRGSSSEEPASSEEPSSSRSSEQGSPPPRRKPIGPLRLTAGPALILRLRAGFGVSAKADLFAMLLGREGEPADLKLLAAATGFTERMIRTATEEMVLAGFIHEIEGRPSSFYAELEPWSTVLQGARSPAGAGVQDSAIPPWRYWSAVFAFLCDVASWSREATEEGWSAYVAASRARDMYGRHQEPLQRAGVRNPPPASAPGEAFMGFLRETVERVRAWARS